MANRPPRITVGLIEAALQFQIEALKKTDPKDPEYGNNLWKIGCLEEQIEAINYRPTAPDLAGWGGDWLGAIREWIKCKFRNGSDVTWGSFDPLVGGSALTPAELERIASVVARAAINQHMGVVGPSGRKGK